MNKPEVTGCKMVKAIDMRTLADNVTTTFEDFIDDLQNKIKKEAEIGNYYIITEYPQHLYPLLKATLEANGYSHSLYPISTNKIMIEW